MSSHHAAHFLLPLSLYRFSLGYEGGSARDKLALIESGQQGLDELKSKVVRRALLCSQYSFEHDGHSQRTSRILVC